MRELDDRLEQWMRSPNLLIACDYDGTLAPIVSDPAQAHPNPESVTALRQLAALPHTHVAVISGRALSDLRRLLGEANHMHLVGSHGSEYGFDRQSPLPPQAVKLREQILHDLNGIAMRDPGFLIEEKPASIAFHYRNVSNEKARNALDAILAGPAKLDGVTIRHGKMVIELSVIAANKGIALDLIRERLKPSRVIFIGDDVTDEDAFATMRGQDVGIKVGPGETCAAFRVADTDEVASLLHRLLSARHCLAAR